MATEYVVAINLEPNLYVINTPQTFMHFWEI